jgi:hypothetical protein
MTIADFAVTRPISRMSLADAVGPAPSVASARTATPIATRSKCTTHLTSLFLQEKHAVSTEDPARRPRKPATGWGQLP